MKKDKELMDFDDRETKESLKEAFTQIFGDISDEEIDIEFQRRFGESSDS